MTGITGHTNPDMVITNMSTNLFLRVDPDGTVWAKISAPTRENRSLSGSLYINGILYTVVSQSFVKVFN